MREIGNRFPLVHVPTLRLILSTESFRGYERGVPILLSAHHLKKAFGARSLFNDLNVVIGSGERIGLIGPNGTGKSTLLQIFASRIPPDGGELSIVKGLRIGYLEQSPLLRPEATVESVVLEGTEDPDDGESQATAQEFISHLGLNGAVGPHSKVGTLSGGWKKKVALARELARRPDLLLLDEPTNHLDVESIRWLETFLSRALFATLSITHDRLFLQRVANRILELDPRNEGGLLSVRGDYATYLDVKASRMAAQEKEEARLSNRLRRETEWLRQGAKARTTKQQARIQRAEELQEEVGELQFRNRERVASLDFQSTGRSPSRLIEAKGISKHYDENALFSNLDLLVTPQSRIGLLGPNGCGKSTLIRTLLGGESPNSGSVFLSDQLKVAYFEQTRESLDPDLTVSQTLVPRGEYVNYRGTFTHVRSYLGRFLFRAEQMDMKAGRLSGGEQSRLLIARLMLGEANLLVLHEPTNDLDTATLDVLEDCLCEFTGAVFLVTHDRYFIDQVAKEILAFDPRPGEEGKIVTFAGLAQWELWRDSLVSSVTKVEVRPSLSAKKRKLSFKEQREWDGMEIAIHNTEMKLANLHAELALPENASRASRLTELSTSMEVAQRELDRLYERWAELEKILSLSGKSSMSSERANRSVR